MPSDNGDEYDYDIRKHCPQCLSDVTTVVETETFPYGIDGPSQVMLTVTVPVRCCASCDWQYTDFEAEDIREAAVKAHLATLT